MGLGPDELGSTRYQLCTIIGGNMINTLKTKIRRYAVRQPTLWKLYRRANRLKVTALRGLSDERYAKLKYRENAGGTLNLEDPQGFNEKIWWLKLNNRDPLLKICSDKVTVREYVKEHGYEEILVPLVGVYEKPTDIPWDDLPDQAFIKTNNGSGTNALWRRGSGFDREAFIHTFESALEHDYYLESREWNYQGIPPRIIVEEILESSTGQPLLDYRFLCFEGKVELVFVDAETAAADGTHNPEARRIVVTRGYELTGVTAKRAPFDPSLAPRPENFERMVDIAETLAQRFPFCRVDLYNIDGRIYFGEITFYPGGGTQIVHPPEWEARLGSMIDLTSPRIVRK